VAASGGCHELDADLAADRGIRIRRRVLASSPGNPIDNKVSVASARLARGSRGCSVEADEELHCCGAGWSWSNLDCGTSCNGSKACARG